MSAPPPTFAQALFQGTSLRKGWRAARLFDRCAEKIPRLEFILWSAFPGSIPLWVFGPLTSVSSFLATSCELIRSATPPIEMAMLWLSLILTALFPINEAIRESKIARFYKVAEVGVAKSFDGTEDLLKDLEEHREILSDPFKIYKMSEEEIEQFWKEDIGPPLHCICLKCRDELYSKASTKSILSAGLMLLMTTLVAILSAPYLFRKSRIAQEDQIFSFTNLQVIIFTITYWISTPLCHWISTTNKGLLGILSAELCRIKHMAYLRIFADSLTNIVKELEMATDMSALDSISGEKGLSYLNKHLRGRQEVAEDFCIFHDWLHTGLQSSIRVDLQPLSIINGLPGLIGRLFTSNQRSQAAAVNDSMRTTNGVCLYFEYKLSKLLALSLSEKSIPNTLERIEFNRARYHATRSHLEALRSLRAQDHALATVLGFPVSEAVKTQIPLSLTCSA
ncbi:hypothetical protein HDU67_006685 [Dinochytrium kinnereticum]|nr:hypothetical protein HDU67_006685 [Dinochytrium kinnereticum]